MRPLVAFLLSVSLGGCIAASPEKHIVELKGIVVTEQGKPVAQAPVAFYEELSRQLTIFPKSDRKIAETRTNGQGEFTISAVDPVPLKKTKLVAEAKKRTEQIAPYSNKVIIDNGVVRNPSKSGSNKIVVPDSYVPAR